MRRLPAVALPFLVQACATPEPVCEAGATQACTCAGGDAGEQVCATDGSTWGTCDCGPVDDSGAPDPLDETGAEDTADTADSGDTASGGGDSAIDTGGDTALPADPSPLPRFFLEGDEASVALDADEMQFLDADGAVLFSQSYDFVEIAFDAWPNATGYAIYGRQSNGTAGGSVPFSTDWIQLADVTATADPVQLATVDLDDDFDGGVGPVLGLGNTVDLVVEPAFGGGAAPAPTGREPVLTLQDGVRPTLSSSAAASSPRLGTNRLQVDQLRLTFNENMDSSSPLDVTDFSPVGGRLSEPQVDGTAYWGSVAPAASADEAFFEDASFEVEFGVSVTLASSDGNTAFTSVELGDATGWALGQTVGFADVSMGTVFYGSVNGINTTTGTLVTTSPGGYTSEAGDVLFDPCSAHDLLPSGAAAAQAIITVSDGTRFAVGQSLEIRPPAGGATFTTIAAIAGNDITLVSLLANPLPQGTYVLDPQCFSGPGNGSFRLRDGVNFLNDANNALVSPFSLDAATDTFQFRFNGGAFDAVPGDRLIVSTQGTVAAAATLTAIETVDADGTPIPDGGSGSLQILRVTDVVALGGTTFPLVLQPAGDLLYVAFDGVEITTASDLTDDSGNGPPDRTRAGISLWDRSGSAILMLPAE